MPSLPAAILACFKLILPEDVACIPHPHIHTLQLLTQAADELLITRYQC